MAYVEAALRRRQMVAAARSVLARDGVARATLRAVAAEAGVPLGTMQYAFRSKEQLLRQLQDWCRRAEASGVAPLVAFSERLRSYAIA
jgi:AcrR family transcriptional regulator